MNPAERKALRKDIEQQLNDLQSTPGDDAESKRESLRRRLRDLVRDEIRDSIDENADGTLIVRLAMPAVVDGTTHRRLTIRPVRVRDVRSAEVGGDPSEIHYRYADVLVEPKNAFEALECERDFTTVLQAIDDQLGKFRKAGWEASR